MDVTREISHTHQKQRPGGIIKPALMKHLKIISIEDTFHACELNFLHLRRHYLVPSRNLEIGTIIRNHPRGTDAGDHGLIFLSITTWATAKKNALHLVALRVLNSGQRSLRASHSRAMNRHPMRDQRTHHPNAPG
jgi:hypothetical protein